MKKAILVVVMLTLCATAAQARVYVMQGEKRFVLTSRGNHFAPRALSIPANRKVLLVIQNQGVDPIQFQSSALKASLSVPGHSSGTLEIGPLKVGTYDYADALHSDNTGTITAR